MDILSYELGKKAGGGGGSNLQNKSVTVITNGSQNITADSGYDGLSKVALTTNVQPTLQTKSVSISSNGTTTVSKDNNYDGMTEVSITTNVQPTNQSKSVTITENTITTISPDTGYDGLSSVEVTTNVSGGDVSDYIVSDIPNLDDFGTSFKYGAFQLIKKVPPITYRNGMNNVSVMQLFARLYNCEEIDVSLITNVLINTQNMFSNCVKLTTIIGLDKLNTSQVTNMSSMFSNCYKLESLDLSNFDTSNTTDMSSMFFSSSGTVLTTLDLSSFDFSKVINIDRIIRQSNLINLTFGTNLGKGYTATSQNYSNYKLDLSTMSNLTHDSLMSVINNLYDLNLSYNVAGGGTLYRQSLVLGSTNLAKLTSAEIQIATDKGWNVS